MNKNLILVAALFSLSVLLVVISIPRHIEKKTIFDKILTEKEIYPKGYTLKFIGEDKNCTDIQFVNKNTGEVLKIYRCKNEIKNPAYKGPLNLGGFNYYYSINKGVWDIAKQETYEFASNLEALQSDEPE